MSEWIRVEDELPEDGEYLLWWYSLNDDVVVGFYDEVEGLVISNYGNVRFLLVDDYRDGGLTHWRPLPPGPEVGDG